MTTQKKIIYFSSAIFLAGSIYLMRTIVVSGIGPGAAADKNSAQVILWMGVFSLYIAVVISAFASALLKSPAQTLIYVSSLIFLIGSVLLMMTMMLPSSASGTAADKNSVLVMHWVKLLSLHVAVAVSVLAYALRKSPAKRQGVAMDEEE